MTRKWLLRIIIFAGATGLVAAIFVWVAPGLRRAADVAVFSARLAAAGPKEKELKLHELMPGDWELVCSSSCYQGKFYLEKYKRSFPSVGECHDGAWGLTFISKDGSARAAGGSCKEPGVSMRTGPVQCLPRESASLSLLAPAPSACRTYLLH